MVTFVAFERVTEKASVQSVTLSPLMVMAITLGNDHPSDREEGVPGPVVHRSPPLDGVLPRTPVPCPSWEAAAVVVWRMNAKSCSLPTNVWLAPVATWRARPRMPSGAPAAFPWSGTHIWITKVSTTQSVHRGLSVPLRTGPGRGSVPSQSREGGRLDVDLLHSGDIDAVKAPGLPVTTGTFRGCYHPQVGSLVVGVSLQQPEEVPDG